VNLLLFLLLLLLLLLSRSVDDCCELLFLLDLAFWSRLGNDFWNRLVVIEGISLKYCFCKEGVSHFSYE